MLNKTSCQLGTNLAVMLDDVNKNLVCANGSLINELVDSSYRPLNPNTVPTDLEFLPLYIADCSEGFTSQDTSKQSVYQCSSHDALMDNYIETLSTLVASHVLYARETVYPKVQLLANSVSMALKKYEVQQPEDFFEVKTYTLPEIFETDLVSDEVLEFTASSAVSHVMNFGEAIIDSGALLDYIKTGNGDVDKLIAQWYTSVDAGKLHGYVFAVKPIMESALAVPDLINYSFINFLFYRSLALRQDLATGLSVIQLVTRASDNRDYYARSLRAGVDNYRLIVKKGTILSTDSNVAFSYLGDKRFCITIYQDNFDKAVEAGATIEQVFGFISKYSSIDLTVDMLKSEGAQYASAWNTVRSLYMTHISGQRDVALKLALKMHTAEAIYDNLSAEDQEFLTTNQGFEQETAKLVDVYVDRLDISCLDRTQDVFIDLVAGIGYRHSSAERIIREMVNAVAKDPSIDTTQAALISTVKYVTDYMIEEITVS